VKVLVIGGGGREHALAWKCAQSAIVTEVFVAPGNAGTALEPQVQNVAISADDIPALLDFAKTTAINLTIVGPEAPLVAGITDVFLAAGLRCFGPSKAASQLEGSKAFTKDFLVRHGIPTAAHDSFTELEPALEYIRAKGAPLVIKADGLAAGKGVIAAHSEAEAEAAVRSMLEDRDFGAAGGRIVIEEFLDGEEASFMAMVDGKHILPLATSQDHKTRDDGDTGPNTGGMGAYSPAPVIDTPMFHRIMDEIMLPTVKGMAADGHPYTGFLYAGIMIGADGIPRVLEFNCRFGDPETQPVLMRLKSDLVELCLNALDGHLNQVEAIWDRRAALGVVMAAGGYPTSYEKGHIIRGLARAEAPDVKVFHAGTVQDGDDIVTSGGRVLCVVALDDSVGGAQKHAYASVDNIKWDGAFCRRDIGHRAVEREEANP
jgi:phosphoribosylamine--glycine ligase